MSEREACPNCGRGRMQEGFLLDRDHNGQRVVNWVEGTPVKGFLGVKVRGRPMWNVATYRCSECGYLASFALAREK